MPVFNRMKAVQYATQWALKRNPDFPDYSSIVGGRGDCSNFVSQVMLAGGWPMILGPKRHPIVWWTERDVSSNSWASAVGLFTYLWLFSGDRVRKCGINDLDLGDIMMMQVPGFTNPDHAMVVTQKHGSDIYLSYHSTDSLHKPLNDIQNRYSNQTTYYRFKVNDSFSSPPDQPSLEDYQD